LPPAFLNLALVTLFADTFAVLYLTTLVRRGREREESCLRERERNLASYAAAAAADMLCGLFL
jgi:hypothetical protein